MENSVYQAPESALVDNRDNHDITRMKRFSAWGVFGLSIITFGIYSIYWIYNRATAINAFHSDKISTNLLNAFLIIVVISFFGQFLFEFLPEDSMFVIAALFGLVNIAYFIIYLVLLFTIRDRLINITGDKISGVLTFFFHAIYLQYRINKAIDEH